MTNPDGRKTIPCGPRNARVLQLPIGQPMLDLLDSYCIPYNLSYTDVMRQALAEFLTGDVAMSYRRTKNPRNCRLQIMVTYDVQEAINRAADTLGVSVSSLCYDLIRHNLESALDGATDPVDGPEEQE